MPGTIPFKVISRVLRLQLQTCPAGPQALDRAPLPARARLCQVRFCLRALPRLVHPACDFPRRAKRP